MKLTEKGVYPSSWTPSIRRLNRAIKEAKSDSDINDLQKVKRLHLLSLAFFYCFIIVAILSFIEKSINIK